MSDDQNPNNPAYVPAAGRVIAPDVIDPTELPFGPPQTDYAPAHWQASPYFNKRDRAVDMVIIHDTEGAYQVSLDWLCSVRPPDKQSSAHYMFRSADGDVTELVTEANIAWHSGNWEYNRRSIGIEHEGFFNAPSQWYTDTMLQASAKLTAAICQRYHIPIDRQHIIGHMEVPDPDHPGQTGGSGHHGDPGKGWPWDKYIALVQAAAGQATQPTPPSSSVPSSGPTMPAISPDYPVYASPTINGDKFKQILQQANSPALAEADDLYRTCTVNGVNPAVALAFFALESNYGTTPGQEVRQNWGNLSDGSGQLKNYDTWTQGLVDWCNHFRLPPYSTQSLNTISQIVPVYQPSSAGGTAAGYANYVQKLHDLIKGWAQ